MMHADKDPALAGAQSRYLDCNGLHILSSLETRLSALPLVAVPVMLIWVRMIWAVLAVCAIWRLVLLVQAVVGVIRNKHDDMAFDHGHG